MESVLDRAAMGMAFLTPEGAWLRVNPALCRLLGYTEAELKQKDLPAVLHPEDAEACRECLRSFATDKAEALEIEQRYVRSDGKTVWGLLHLSNQPGADNQPASILAQFQDVSRLRQAEDGLRWMNSFLKAKEQASPDGIVVMNAERTILTANHRMDELWNIPPDLPEPEKPGWILKQTRDPAKFQEHMRRVLANPRLTTRTQIEMADGRTLDEHISPILGRDGEFYGRLFTCRDITPSQRALAQLEQLFAHSPDMLLIAGYDGTIKRANPAAELILGYSNEELLRQSLKDLLVTEERSRAEEAVRKIIEEGQFQQFETRCCGKDGSIRWIEMSAVRLPGEDSFYLTGRDVTKRKTIELELAITRHDQETILGGVGDGVHWIGEGGRIKFENPAGAAMLGYESNELAGQPAHHLMHHTRADGTPYPVEECPVYRTMRDGRTRHITGEVFWRKDGSHFAVEYTVVATRDLTQKFNGAVVTFVDITVRLRLEEQMRLARVAAETANEAKTQFLANMSHEIRTPLNGIIGMTDLMAGTTLNVEQRDFLDTIRASGENLLTTVNDVLDFSKIEFGKLELDFHAFSLLDLIDDVIGLLSYRIVKKNLAFVTNIQSDLPVDYLGDATRVRQVLVNLVSNAVKFTEQGEIKLEVLSAPLEPGDFGPTRRLLFRVVDTGVGIPSDRLDRLFKIFSQVDASTTRRYGGSGMGLAICRKLVEIMGGRIGVESRPEMGSSFSFVLPLEVAHPELASQQSSELAGHRVLIIDDLETNRRMLTLQLARWGMEWVDVGTGQEALDLLARGERFDVALIDFQMPNTDGMMVGRQIMRVLEGRPMPLVLVSSQTGYLSADECRQAGFSAVLAKPLRQNLLRSTLLQAFRGDTIPIFQPATPLLSEGMPLRLLTVEDNATNQKVARQILKRLGYETDVVNNGEEAVLALRSKTYDLIFMDIHMPQMDGLEATRAIRQETYAEGQPLIIALTADVLPGEREKCLEAGMDDYIPKPIKIDSLKGIIEKIKHRRLLRAAVP